MKKCKILGFKIYDEKDEDKKLTGNKMLRIIITIDSDNKDGYYGRIPVAIYFKYDENLISDLNLTINEDREISYETEENIITNKTKVSKLIF